MYRRPNLSDVSGTEPCIAAGVKSIMVFGAVDVSSAWHIVDGG